MKKVVAVTVTYNSGELLRRAINALLNQTVKLEKIIVVDNASNEENKKIIEEIAESSEIIDVLWLENNSGGAGGFEAGVKYVHINYDYDWVWLMDDDAFPTVNCLEKLLRYDTLIGVGCLCPLIYGVDNEKFQLYHHKLICRFLSKDKQKFDSVDKIPEYSELEANAFVGPLISKQVVSEVGFPDGKLFIYGDDLEYIYRISRKFKVYLIKSAVINHRDVKIDNAVNYKSWWKDYYMYRNRYLFINKYAGNRISRFIGRTIIGLALRKNILNAKLSKHSKEIKKLKIGLLKRALKDGKNNVYGKSIDPGEYVENVNAIINKN